MGRGKFGIPRPNPFFPTAFFGKKAVPPEAAYREATSTHLAAGHGMYAFEQGVRLGLLLAVECLGPDLLRP